MKMNSTVSMVGLSLLVFAVLIGAAVWKNNAPGKYDALTQCITDKGGKSYEAYWCSACAQQQEILGSSHRLIERVECSSPGSNTFDLCPDISSTPTWERADGERFVGVRTPEELADLFDCPLEEGA